MSHEPKMAKKPEWAPRIWQGCNVSAWTRLLIKNRFAVHPSRLYIAVIVTVMSVTHSVLGWLQTLIYGRAVNATKLAAPPIFILGHWRNGTTLLHELMIQDPRFAYPTTYQCVDPNHFLLTESLFTKLFGFLLPHERPMDHMKAGWDRPQEDEFALCMLGVPSPYTSIAFPNSPPHDQDYLDLERVPAPALARWKQALTRFLQQITYKTGKRIVLKSPPHTARIKALKEMFPGALFVHIMRDPYVVFASTVNLWRTLDEVQGFQAPNHAGLEERVFETFNLMHARLEEGKRLLPVEQFFELRYEDLVQDPVATLQNVYDHLQLGGWEAMEPRLKEFVATLRGYETNKYQQTPSQRDEITRRWGDVIQRYGYDRPDEFRTENPEPAALSHGM
ncbi:MAG: sulfotransferase [Planctomycetota bacterium]